MYGLLLVAGMVQDSLEIFWVIVEPEDVDRGLKPVRAGRGVVAARGDRPGGIFGMNDVAKSLREARPILLVDLVADAPHDHAGVTSFPPNHGLQVPGVPGVEEPAVIAGRFAPPPAVKRLNHHQKAHPIGQVKQLGRGRIVRRPDGIETRRLQQLDFSHLGPVTGDGADDPIVMVQTAAI